MIKDQLPAEKPSDTAYRHITEQGWPYARR